MKGSATTKEAERCAALADAEAGHHEAFAAEQKAAGHTARAAAARVTAAVCRRLAREMRRPKPADALAGVYAAIPDGEPTKP